MRLDQRTLGDLEIFECRDGSGSLFDLFDTSRTSGGSAQRLGLALLEREGVLEMLRALPRVHAAAG